MKKPWILPLGFLLAIACNTPTAQQTPQDSVAVTDSSSFEEVIPDADSVMVAADSVHVDSTLLPGKWMQPVPGLDSLTHGIYLRKNGKASSINMQTYVYTKWQLSKDTLVLWSHTEGRKDSVRTIDTLLIKSLDDTSMVLFPLKAAPGYLEKYTRRGKGK